MLNERELNLQLFAEGGDGSSAGAGSATTGENNVSSVAEKKGEYANVLFGKQAEPLTSETVKETKPTDQAKEEVTDPQKEAQDKRKAFLDLVKGEYKDIYTQETQNIINKRFKETKELEAKNAQYQGLVDNLMAKYNVTDFKALTTAIDNDNSAWETFADEAGMSVDQYKQFKTMERENARLKAEQSQRIAQANADAQLQRWNEEAKAVKDKFPNFNLEADVKDQRFQAMLRSGVPMEHAYKTLHFDELMQDSVKTTAENTEKAVVENIRAKGSRPSENASSTKSAFTVKNDVTKLTRADRAEIARRASRGENISF